jgi:hypothetical protein
LLDGFSLEFGCIAGISHSTCSSSVSTLSNGY